MQKIILKIKLNLLKFQNLLAKERIFFVSESADWIIKRIGVGIVNHLNSENNNSAKLVYSDLFLRNKIVHYGSVNTFLKHGKLSSNSKANKNIVTWFHYLDNHKEKLELLVKNIDHLHRVVTACSQTKNIFVEAGIPENKIKVIPLGVELDLFTQPSVLSRKDLGIPEDAFVLGSFQKDGNGWGDGETPKLIKGPDIFVEVVSKLKDKIPKLFVLLVGPARGYVKNGLEKNGVKYHSIGYLKEFTDVVPFYSLLDLYMITSRVEGGPQQFIEAWAAGVPVVATKVGMIADHGSHKKNILLADVGNVDKCIDNAYTLYSDQKLRDSIVEFGREAVKSLEWEKLFPSYFDLYRFD